MRGTSSHAGKPPKAFDNAASVDTGSDHDTDQLRAGRFDILVLILALLLVIFTFVVDLQTPGGIAAAVAYMAAVFAVLWLGPHLRAPLTILVATICSALTGLGYFLSPPGGVLWMVALNRGVALLAIWLTAITGLRYAAAREQLLYLTRLRERRAREEAKTLSGLLPICAHCKDIRDDEGYWRQLEEYITSHSEAHFSHGFCPKCQQEYYGEYLKETPEG